MRRAAIAGISAIAAAGITLTILFTVIGLPSGTDIPIIEQYDCAKTFDKFAQVYQKEKYWIGQIPTHVMDYGNFSPSFIEDENVYHFYDNRCYTTYNSWKVDSNFEYFIDQHTGIFNEFSNVEQMLNQEIPCIFDEYTCDSKI